MNTMLALGLVAASNLLPVALWAWVYVSRDPSREPRILLLFAFFIGGLTTLPVMLINSWLASFDAHLLSWPLATMVLPVLGAAFVEEVCKHCGVMFVMSQDRLAHDEVLDGIIYAVITALGFAFVENTVYTWLSLAHAGSLTTDVMSLYILRSVLSMFAHTIFSGFFGYYYALGYIAPQLQQEEDRRKLTIRAMTKGSHVQALAFGATTQILRGKVTAATMSRHTSFQLILEGLWLAVILHMLYNLFLTWPPFGLSPFLVVTPYLGLLGIIVMWLIVQVRRQKV